MVAEFNNPIYSLIAKPEIKTYADLKGKLLGMAAENGSITISIRKLLAMKGLQRGRLRTQFVDGTPERLSCLTAGDCVAVPLGPAAGFRRDAAGLPAARAVDRGGAGIRLHGDGGAALLGARPTKKRSCAMCARSLPRSNSSAIPRKRNDVVRTIVETTGFPEANARLTLRSISSPSARCCRSGARST